jgi:hypothetical protein
MVPADFQLPGRILTDRFLMRPLIVSDAEPDYEAWRSSLDHLRGVFGPDADWPTMSLHDNAIDLAWHQRERDAASSFAYTVFDPTDTTCLGCVYICPPRKVPFDAEVFYWVRASEVATGLDDDLGSFVRRWVTEAWPFTSVAFPGRDIPWETFGALEDREHW